MLINFFDVVAAYTLKPFKPAAKILPNELQDRILDMVDPDTYTKCSDVSGPFRNHVQNYIRLTQQPNLTSRPHQDSEFTHHVINVVSSTIFELTIFDSVESRHVQSNFGYLNDGGVADARNHSMGSAMAVNI
jgi:hypothetical protein